MHRRPIFIVLVVLVAIWIIIGRDSGGGRRGRVPVV